MYQLTALLVKSHLLSMIPRLLQDYHQYLLYILLLLIGAPVIYPRKKQRDVPSVPIVGVEGPWSVDQARENFTTDARTILLEGYRQACRLWLPPLREFIAKRKSVQQ